MFRALSIAAVMALGTLAPVLPSDAANNSATPAPATASTPPPEIYHVITRPLCSVLHERIAPAIGMMLENDTTIKKSPDLFKQYNHAQLLSPDYTGTGGSSSAGAAPSQNDEGNGTMNPSQNMALLGMENLIRPLANNIIAIQKLLDSPELMQGTGKPDDDQHLQAIRAQLLKAVAMQSASLDIISGFVDTQQMGDLQHSGQEYISAMNQNDLASQPMSAATPNPLMQDPNQAGLPPNPYDISLNAVPGLALGYNPVTRLIDGLHWTMGETSNDENEAAKSVMTSAALCGNVPANSTKTTP
jgi:hypothetical protein